MTDIQGITKVHPEHISGELKTQAEKEKWNNEPLKWHFY